MCLILFAYRSHPDRPLVVAANRDEFYARPARAAHWWDEGQTVIFGGRDNEALGTWLAVSRDGRLAAVTNWTEDRSAPQSPRSRGDLPWHFLRGVLPARDFVDTIDPDHYAGFNFIAYDGVDLVYTSNRTGDVRVLGRGVYGLTNTRLGPPHGAPQAAHQNAQRMAKARLPGGDGPAVGRYEQWPKAVFGAAALADIAPKASTDDLIQLLSLPHLPLETPPDRELAPERSYSPCFIHGADYGTRASTAVILARDSLEFVERQYERFGEPGERSATTIKFGRTPK
ncbi:MAG: NRDE family protein [Gammaproteobacteria bacterium]|nr:NRDE family protein [Gammaproteobacteria bacterium]